ncbi:hypothetical protein GCM10028784_36890 [Myceligenerans cantabricum]
MTVYFRTAEVDAFSPNAVADTVEVQLLASGDAYLSYSEYRDLFPAGSGPAAIELETGFAEVEDRARVMGRHYPFSFDGQGVRFDPSGTWEVYAFLLLLSLRGTPFRENQDWKRSDPLFDFVVMRAFASKYSEVLHFGWPPRGDRPPTFPEAIDWAAESLGLELRSVTQSLPTHRQDGGVDVIAWNPYADRANGFPVVLVQNTIQQHFAGKPADVDPLLWRDWINFGNTPGVGFAVPFVLTADDPWRPQVISRVLDFVDRPRLMEMLASDEPSDWDRWAGITSFVAEQLAAIQQEATATAASVAPARSRKRKARPPRPATA